MRKRRRQQQRPLDRQTLSVSRYNNNNQAFRKRQCDALQGLQGTGSVANQEKESLEQERTLAAFLALISDACLELKERVCVRERSTTTGRAPLHTAREKSCDGREEQEASSSVPQQQHPPNKTDV
jgi:hypothetical protein